MNTKEEEPFLKIGSIYKIESFLYKRITLTLFGIVHSNKWNHCRVGDYFIVLNKYKISDALYYKVLFKNRIYRVPHFLIEEAILTEYE